MQTAEALLEIIHERGKRGLPLERLYRHLFNPELYLRSSSSNGASRSKARAMAIRWR